MTSSPTDAPDSIAELRSFTEKFFDEQAFLSWIGVSLQNIEPGRAVLSVPFNARLTNPEMVSPGTTTFHGGVIATLIDTAGGTALRSTFDEPTSTLMTSINLDVTYLRAVTGDISCTAEVVRAGGTVGVVNAAVESEGDDGSYEAAVGRGVYRLFRAGSYNLG